MSRSNARILIVDDEVDACANLSDILTDLGYQVDVAYDGPSALEKVKMSAYDVALLDLKMPDMDGVELYRRIKAIRSGMVAIIVTAFAGSATAQASLDLGAVEIVAKPINFPNLLRLVEHALQQPFVLVIDDDLDLCDSLWAILREQNYRVCLAHDAIQSEKLLELGDIHVVLIDMKLPGADGAQVYQRVHRSHPEARTILITGARSEMERRIEDALAHGADAVAYKPFDVPQLLDTVKRLAQPNES